MCVCVCADVPDPIDLGMLRSTVMNLLQIVLTWRRPDSNNADIRSYTLSYCHQLGGNTCIPPVTLLANSSQLTAGTRGTDSENNISYVLPHVADLNTNINVTIVANNRVGMGTSINGPAAVPVATTGIVCVCVCVCV